MLDDIRSPKLPGTPLNEKPNVAAAEVSFNPPERIAQEEEFIDMASHDSKPEQKTNNKKLWPVKKIQDKIHTLLDRLKIWWGKRSKKQKIAISIALAAGIILVGMGVFALINANKPDTKSAPAVVKKEGVKEPPKPTTVPSNLTGMTVPADYNLLPVTGVMIENSPDARPQSGLHEAGVVFEAVAEGGITRFLALFQEAQPDYVGPVRSVRPYYLQWLQGFDAAVAHVGGSAEALAKIRNESIKDLDQSFNGGSFQRISSRYAPHNVYTSLGSLIALSKSKGYNSSTFTSFPRKADKPGPAPTAKSVSLAISGPLYNVSYNYDAASNSYLRTLAGVPHKDERSGKQISPKVVIGLVTAQGIHPDGLHTTYQTLGSGTVFVFQDGLVTQGTWSKANDKEQLKFIDAAGVPIALNAGQTWITAVSSAASVVSTP